MCLHFIFKIKQRNAKKRLEKKRNLELIQYLEDALSSFYWEESLSKVSCDSEDSQDHPQSPSQVTSQDLAQSHF